jgi:uncharacterized ion transporter superfamily protein YfcC|tara:strand:- start:44 stop:235 length:192 start_codon:yes stop_codon:yes gene_type:complete
MNFAFVSMLIPINSSWRYDELVAVIVYTVERSGGATWCIPRGHGASASSPSQTLIASHVCGLP